MRQYLLLLLLLLTGCSGLFRDEVAEGMNYLQGKPADAAINLLGWPDEDKEIAGRRVLIWKRSSFTRVPDWQSGYATTHGWRGNRRVDMVTEYQINHYHTEKTSCQLRAILDDNDRIMTWDRRDNSACWQFAKALRGAANLYQAQSAP